MIRTHEGAQAYEHTLDHHVEFFSKAGSLRDRKGRRSFYEGEETALSLFQKTWIVPPKELSMKLLLWLRDCRGGSGNRSGFRNCVKWLAEHDSEWVLVNLHQIPELGRWDDLRCLFGTKLEEHAAKLWAEAIYHDNGLAAKWAKREDVMLMKYLRKTYFYNEKFGEAQFRKYLARQRKVHSNIVETKMCNDDWESIIYNQVPSVAMARYTNAFTKHDEERFSLYQRKLQTGEEKIHASVLFPHDCVITALKGQKGIADAQFGALPNWMEKNKEKIVCICDTSGSMENSVSSSRTVERVHVSMGLSLYCSDRIGKDSPFYRKFVGFCSEGRFINWSEMTFSQAINNPRVFDGAVGSTRVDRALNLILNLALKHNVPPERMPTTLLIISDMQFTSSVQDDRNTEVERSIKEWVDSGYYAPKIVYWSVAGYAGSPATVRMPNTALISGFSPATLKAVLSGDDFTPKGCMLRAVEKYKVNIPGDKSKFLPY